MRQTWVPILPLLLVSFSLLCFSSWKVQIPFKHLKGLMRRLKEKIYIRHKATAQNRALIEFWDALKGLQLEWTLATMVWCHFSVLKICSHSSLFPCSLPPCGSCRVLPIIKGNWLFFCINQNLHIWNFPISLWEDDYLLDRGLLGSLMRQRNALHCYQVPFTQPSPCGLLHLGDSIYMQLSSPAVTGWSQLLYEGDMFAQSESGTPSHHWPPTQINHLVYLSPSLPALSLT